MSSLYLPYFVSLSKKWTNDSINKHDNGGRENLSGEYSLNNGKQVSKQVRKRRGMMIKMGRARC